MITPSIFDLTWHIEAVAVCVASTALLCRLCAMQPVAQVRHVCAACRRVARAGDEEHGRVTEKLVVIGGRR